MLKKDLDKPQTVQMILRALDDSRNRYYLMVFLSELLHFIGRNTKSYHCAVRTGDAKVREATAAADE